MNRKTTISEINSLLADGDTKNPLTVEELDYLQARGFKYNGHTHTITTIIKDGDTAELLEIEAILRKLPEGSCIHFQITII